MKISISRFVEVHRSARVLQVSGMFDIPPAQISQEEWTGDLPIEQKDWHVGLIVGPSGCGKSTIAKELFGDALVQGYDWSPDRSILDGFPPDLSVSEITQVLGQVGFSSPPLWLRPFHVLSNGQQFRVTVARSILGERQLFAIDEFTSVVDRVVAQIGSAAIGKAVRARKRKFVAVSCHYDIIPWLQPDWVFEPATMRFDWRSVQPRPPINIEIRRVHRSAWNIFKKYHYLTADLHTAAHCYVAFYGDTPVAFFAVLASMNPVETIWRLHRTVCLPDYQGCGIATAATDAIAAFYATSGRRVYAATGHPGLVRYRAKSPLWEMTTTPHISRRAGDRLVATFRYVGKVQEDLRAFTERTKKTAV